jgi:hypothetical protein
MTARCSISGCFNASRLVLGWCTKHYQRWRKHGDPEMVSARLRGTPYEKLLRVGSSRRGECLLWAGKLSPNGYATYGHGGQIYLAHRVSYETWHGPIPDEMQIDHACHNEAAWRGECEGGWSCPHRRCVNPAHLRAVTQSQNMLATPTLGRARRAKRDARTTCVRGHPWVAENLYQYPHSTKVACRTCNRESALRHWRRKKALNG